MNFKCRLILNVQGLISVSVNIYILYALLPYVNYSHKYYLFLEMGFKALVCFLRKVPISQTLVQSSETIEEKTTACKC